MGYGMKCGGDNGIIVKKLWSNDQPTSIFLAQTVALDMTDYEMFAIRYQYGTNEEAQVCYFQSGLVGSKVGLESFGTGTTVRRRLLQSSATGFVFEDGYSGGNVLNTANIPLDIYGIRGIRM